MKQWKSLVGLHSSASSPYPEAEEKQLQEATAVINHSDQKFLKSSYRLITQLRKRSRGLTLQKILMGGGVWTWNQILR